MAIVKIRFCIEVDGELLIDHKIEQEKNNSFDKEREFAEEVINKLNTFYTGMNIHKLNWADLVEMRKQYQKHLKWQKEHNVS
ncbi:TPA: hypothetical protein ACU203_002590 [Mannheimia haemolytica]|nr:hypothetical protein [Mannheimia haemolytica]